MAKDNRVILIASNEEDQQIGRSHGILVVDKWADAYDRGAWSVWEENKTQTGKTRKRRWAVGKVAWSKFLRCSGVHAYSYHATMKAAIARAKANHKDEGVGGTRIASGISNVMENSEAREIAAERVEERVRLTTGMVSNDPRSAALQCKGEVK